MSADSCCRLLQINYFLCVIVNILSLLMNEAELTKVTQKDLDEAITDVYDYVYSSDGKRLLSCHPVPKEVDSWGDTYIFSLETPIICDNACDINHCSWMYLDEEFDVKLYTGVTHLGDYAFKGRELRFVEIPSTLIYMGANPFALTHPRKYIIDDNKKFVFRNGNLIDIEQQKLIHNISIGGEIVIDEDVNEIGEYAFSRREFIQNDNDDGEVEGLSIIIPSTIQTIGNNAFENCDVSTVIFLALPQSIGADLFMGCELLEKIHVPYGMGEVFRKALPDVSEYIDDSGLAVNEIVHRNMLTSIGIKYFYKISLDSGISVYGYMKDKKFHLSDEKGREINRESVGLSKGVLVFEIEDNQYKLLPPKRSREDSAFAVDEQNNISWFKDGERFYVPISENQIIIPKTDFIDEYAQEQEKYETARFFGKQTSNNLTAYNKDVYSYSESGKKRLICNSVLYPDKYDNIEVFPYKTLLHDEWTVIVCLQGAMGMITYEGKYIKPQYKSIYPMQFPLFKIENCKGEYGVINAQGEMMIAPVYKVLNYDDSGSVFFIVTDEDIHFITYSWIDNMDYKVRIYTSVEIPEIEKCNIKKWGTTTLSCETRGRVERAAFLKIVKEDGKCFYYTHYGEEISNWSKMLEWSNRWDDDDVWDWRTQ